MPGNPKDVWEKDHLLEICRRQAEFLFPESPSLSNGLAEAITTDLLLLAEVDIHSRPVLHGEELKQLRNVANRVHNYLMGRLKLGKYDEWLESIDLDRKRELSKCYKSITDDLLRNVEASEPAAQELENAFREFDRELENAYAPLRKKYQEFLREMEGKSFEDFETNRWLAARIQDIARSLGRVFTCTRCKAPARFKCIQAGASKRGAFVFAHDDTTHSAGSSVPGLFLTKPPIDRRKKN